MASRTISTKLAIEGESQYRAAVTKINGDLKTLQSSLKLTESQYKTNANSMQALTAKGKALHDLYDKQRSKVNELKAALENAQNAEKKYADQKAELTAKIKANEEALEKLRSSTGDTAREEAELTEENKRLNEELTKADANLEASEKGVNSWQTQLNSAQAKLYDLDGEIQTNNKYLAEAKTSADGCASSIDQYGKAVKEAEEKTTDFSGAFQAMAGALAAAGVQRAVKEIAGALNECVEVSKGFESGMATVAAVSGASEEELAKLTDTAKRYAASSVFTAQDVASAYNYMAMAGWDAGQMLSGLEGIMSLSAASGEDLGMVCDIVTDALTAFGLQAADSAHFSDILAQTASSANTNVSLMGETFKYVAPVAGALGYSAEDAAVAIGLMANSGIKASSAGTALRGMLTRMAKPTKEVAGAMETLGVSLTDEQGNMLSFRDVLSDLRAGFDGMNEAQKTEIATALAGKNAMSGLLAIVNSSEADWDKLTAAIDGCEGAAQRMSDIKLDTYEGQVKLLESAMEGLQIEVGDQLTPTLGKFAEAGADALAWATDFVHEHKAVVPLITAVVAGLGTLTVGVAGVTFVTNAAVPAIAAFNAALAANPIGFVVVGITAAIAAITALVAFMDNSAVPSVKELTAAAQNMKTAMEDANDSYASSVGATEAAASMADKYISKLEELEAAGLNTDEQQKEYHTTLALLCQTVPELADLIDLETDTIDGGTAALKKNTDAWKRNAIEQAKQEKLSALYAAYADVMLEAEENSIKLQKAEEDRLAAQADLAEAQERMNQLWEEAEEKQAKVREETGKAGGVVDYLSDEYWELQSALTEFERTGMNAEATIQNCTTAIEKDQEAISDAEREVETFEEAFDNLTGAQKDNADAVQAVTNGISLLEDMANRATVEIQAQADVVESINGMLEELAQEYKDAYDEAYKSISSQAGLFGDFAAEISEDTDTVEEMMEHWAKQTENVGKYTENLQKAAQYGIDDGLIASLSDGSTQSAGYLQTIIDKIEEMGGSTEGMSQDAEEFVTKFNESFAKTGEAKEGFTETVLSMRDDLKEAFAALEDAAGQVNFSGIQEAFEDQLGAVGLTAEQFGLDLSEGLDNGIKNGLPEVEVTAEEMAEMTLKKLKNKYRINSPSKATQEIGEYFDLGLIAGFEAKQAQVSAAVQKLGNDVQRIMENSAKKTVSSYLALFGTLPDGMEAIGEETVNGLIRGLNNRSGALYNTMRGVVDAAMEASKAAADIHSPSHKTEEQAELWGEGYIVGLEKKRQQIAAMARGTVTEALKLDVSGSVDGLLEKIDTRIPTIPPPAASRESGVTYTIQEGAIKIEVHGDGEDAEAIAARTVRKLNRELDRAAWAKGAKKT